MIELWCRPPEFTATRIRIGNGPSTGLPAAIEVGFAGRSVHAIVDRRVVDAHPGAQLDADHGTLIDGGEALKTFTHLEQVLRTLARCGMDRRGVVAAVGGGTVGDLAGLAAALYLRGVELLMVPTTLLAMVDSSVGGKTAVNLPEGKNLAGTLWSASEVWIDPAFVTSLPETEWRSGLGEVLKIAIGLDADLFDWLERAPEPLLRREPNAVAEAVERSLRAKIRIVERDPRENGPRRLLNLGHTLGHALEAHSGFAIPHGVAVARGIHHALDVASVHGRLAAVDAERCRGLLRRFGFAAGPLPAAAALAPFLQRDKKIDGDVLFAVLPTAIGQSEAFPLDRASFLPSV